MADDPTDDIPAAITALTALVEELRAEVAELRARPVAPDAGTPRMPWETLRAAGHAGGRAGDRTAGGAGRPDGSPTVATPGAGTPAAATAAEDQQDRSARPLGRRRALLGLAGAAAAGTVAAVAPGSPAAAGDGDPFMLGTDNHATERTRLVDGGLSVIDGTLEHRWAEAMIDAQSTDRPAIGAWTDTGITAIRANAGGNGFGILATSEEGTGLQAEGGFTGVLATSPFIGMYAQGGVGGLYVAGTRAAILMEMVEGEPTDTEQEHWPGMLSMRRLNGAASQAGALWLCVAEGEPGTWRKLAGHDTAGSLHLLPAPARVYDSRPGHHPTAVDKGALPGGTATRTIDLTANDSGVPAGATGALITVLVVNAPRGNGNLTLWAAGQPQPQANTMVWGGDAGRFTTLAMSAVDEQARVQVATSTRTHLVLDVVGYYR